MVGDRHGGNLPHDLRSVIGATDDERVIWIWVFFAYRLASDIVDSEEAAVLVETRLGARDVHGYDKRREAQAEAERTVGSVCKPQAYSGAQPDYHLPDEDPVVGSYD